ncbi:MAG TPA: CHAT domain-containing tetratricopeptide repeat protein, partial [Terracidiphilus sp.]|nr:CHAT domain-containing tetratricopeptide repeat protein [Terracidiphilus sp.]
AHRAFPNDLHYGVIEANLGTAYLKKENFPLAAEHTQRAVEMLGKLYGDDSVRVMQMHSKLGDLYTRTGQFPQAWKAYEVALRLKQAQMDMRATYHASFSLSLAQGGDLKRAVEEGLTAEQMSREMFVLQARTLPERQALAYNAVRPHGLEVPLSVILGHSEFPANDIYEEMIRSRALVADEMARRQRNLNRSNDPDTARLLDELNKARAALLALEQAPPAKAATADAIAAATQQMENVERQLAERSAAVRDDEGLSVAGLKELQRAMPPGTALVSYVAFGRRAVAKPDPAMQATPWYMAFVLRSGSDRFRVFDLGTARSIDDLVTRLRASADAEAHAGGLNSLRNERAYRQAGEALRKRIWDPLRPAMAGAKTAVVVPDGMLNLVPFAGLPDGTGYLVESHLVIRVVSSERDLLPSAATTSKHGLLAVGAPQFDLVQAAAPDASTLRDATIPCDEFQKLEFPPLPGAQQELNAIGLSWKRWNRGETLASLTGPEATRDSFLDAATRNRVLHVATHAFVLDSKCGGGNPLLRSGLVFAGANRSRASAILTAQQIASLDLNGVDLAVLSACNTGAGELTDGEGVLGLERAFRIAGARSVVMTLWPVDDKVTGRYMRALYGELLAHRASASDAVWTAGRRTLLARRAAGLSTHPWYWAGFVASGWQ